MLSLVLLRVSWLLMTFCCCCSADTVATAVAAGIHLLQGWVLDNVVVPTAAGYGLEDEYRYLRPSIQRFPQGDEQERLALDAGFSKAKHYELGFGLMGCLVATK